MNPEYDKTCTLTSPFLGGPGVRELREETVYRNRKNVYLNVGMFVFMEETWLGLFYGTQFASSKPTLIGLRL